MSRLSWLVAGSDLYTGQVLYLDYTAEHTSEQVSQWVTNIHQVQVLDKAQAQEAMQQAKEDHKNNLVVDPYLIQLSPLDNNNADSIPSTLIINDHNANTFYPSKKREQMRIQGPSIFISQ